MSSKLFSFYIILISFLITSCYSTKKLVYFTDLKDTTFTSQMVIPEPVFQPNDLLSISISSLSEDASMIFNTPNTSGAIASTSSSTGNSVEAKGYLINYDGYIHLPLIGNIMAAGQTKSELQKSITSQLVSKKLLLDPIVNIRSLSFKVTVIGDVLKPSVFNVPTEKITLFEAIGLAGDLTITGKRENVLIIREENGVKLTHHINLNTQAIFTSPFYYLKPNDVVYVEPNKDKVASSSRSLQWIPAITSTMSLLIIIFSQLNK